jgi:preprotein translocase subunit SecG|tara:strand:- start:591 stop:872 length:282 start_codon:yes stop_codon:yes gene_type:complete
MAFLISIMSFANFVFYPLVVGSIIAVIIEQILRAIGNEDDPKAVRNVFVSMGIRKYLIRQAWLFNIIWFVGYFILLIINRPGQQAMPDMIWQG